MKIIVCGAGNVGRSIVSYLVKGNNDIVVIDNNARRLEELGKEFDVLPVLGEASHPDILERAGADETDLLLAVTNRDEVNMITCQIAHSLFQIPHKIARIDSEAFLDPLWETLYSDNHLPVDMIISPDIEIARNILKILKYPGNAGVIPVLQDEAAILTLKITPNCPFLETPIMHMSRVNPELEFTVVNILRDGSCFIPEAYNMFEMGDEVNILVTKEKIDKTIRGFGLDTPGNERLVIFGGNLIAKFIGRQAENDDSIISCKIIEENMDEARNLAKELSHVVVIQGEMMSDVILDEANINHADASIAITLNDKDNLLASMVAAQNGVTTNISVVNTPSYSNLIFNINNNILVDRSAITISKILKEIRKVKMIDAHVVSRGCGEIWEIRATEASLCCGKKIGELNLHKFSRIFAIKRGEELIYPLPTTDIEVGDILMLYVDSSDVRHAEKVLS